ncbi:hypothetical protein HC752_12745 [Vibrio sp. S9_S30]|uniref:SMP-30/gluconolactonase/LRE family protein n=1 Tax=Vibrio sp. S9_S30 TaxID=2720226 RepID=UPI00168184CF|nr:SMP-30/gluconolactonase/LRE family protein [Vibrio sp. S9_S30]MBD1557801.1 hypothetical protein [Vibrio sp. S9_S30]
MKLKYFHIVLASLFFHQAQAFADISLEGECIFPEGISAKSDGTMYVGSMQQGSILRIEAGAKTGKEFIKPNTNGLVSTLGVYVDESNNRLLACSADPGIIHKNVGDGRFDGSKPTAIHLFDLEKGTPIQKVDFPGGGFCNDLVSDDKGNIYATDSYHGRILKYDGNTISVWAIGGKLSDRLWTLNGIELNNTQDVLFVTNQKTGEIFSIGINEDGNKGDVNLLPLSRKFNADGIRFLPDGRLGAIEKGNQGKFNAIDIKTGEVEVIADNIPSPATFVPISNNVYVTSTQGENYWKKEGSCSKATHPFNIIELKLD